MSPTCNYHGRMYCLHLFMKLWGQRTELWALMQHVWQGPVTKFYSVCPDIAKHLKIRQRSFWVLPGHFFGRPLQIWTHQLLKVLASRTFFSTESTIHPLWVGSRVSRTGPCRSVSKLHTLQIGIFGCILSVKTYRLTPTVPLEMAWACAELQWACQRCNEGTILALCAEDCIFHDD